MRLKIWLDFCEPKSVVMLRPLYNRLIQDHDMFITARDFGETYPLLEKWGVPYIPVGAHGGATIANKLHAYIDRLDELLAIVEKEKPNFLFCITSPEAIRIAFGLGIPHIMFYDEPRSVGCSKLTISMVEHLVVPRPIPFEWYAQYGIAPEKVIRFNGIDEVGWLNPTDFHPKQEVLSELGLTPQQYIVCRPVATQSYAHLKGEEVPQETILTDLVRKIYDFCNAKKRPMKFLIIPRYKEQFEQLEALLSPEIKKGIVLLKKVVANLADVMYYAAIVISGGGTMVRESGLLGVPSIEYIASETYPQEQFLINNGFPLVHVKTAPEIYQKAVDYLIQPQRQDRWEKIKALENPIEMGFSLFKQIMKC